jgi:hypothetical protein
VTTRGASGIKAARLLGVLGGGQPEKGQAFRLATIPAGYTSGQPTLIFDGETDVTVRTYPVADHVTTLAPGKTVLVAMVGTGGVIIAAWTR